MTDDEVKKVILAGIDMFEKASPGSLGPNARAMAVATLRVGTHPLFQVDADAPMHEKMKLVDFVHKRMLH